MVFPLCCGIQAEESHSTLDLIFSWMLGKVEICPQMCYFIVLTFLLYCLMGWTFFLFLH
jgi:hypothetical protein